MNIDWKLQIELKEKMMVKSRPWGYELQLKLAWNSDSYSPVTQLLTLLFVSEKDRQRLITVQR